MTTPKERLSHLLELAASGPSDRAAFAGELTDLLLDWPPQYPASMRATFEALLEKIIREMDCASRGALATRFEGRDDFAPSLMNEFFLVASPALKDAILLRNDVLEAAPGAEADCDTLLAAARSSRDFGPALARIAGVPDAVAHAAMADAHALATLAKGIGVNRATFSAIAILAGPARTVHENFRMLATFDRVPPNGARQLVAFWRLRAEPAAIGRAA